MANPRRVRWYLMLFAALACLGLGACSGGSPGGGGNASPQAGRLDDLKAALAKSGGPFAYTVGFGELVSGSGAQDATGANTSLHGQVMDATSGLKVTTDLLLIGADAYLKLDFGDLAVPGLGPVGKRWMHVDAKKIATSTLGVQPGRDNLSPQALLGAAMTATRTGDQYSGTLAVTGLTLPFVGTATKTATEVDYVATVDGDGRIAGVTITLPASENRPFKLVVAYSDYGKAVTLAKPAAKDIITAPDMVYQFLR